MSAPAIDLHENEYACTSTSRRARPISATIASVQPPFGEKWAATDGSSSCLRSSDRTQRIPQTASANPAAAPAAYHSATSRIGVPPCGGTITGARKKESPRTAVRGLSDSLSSLRPRGQAGVLQPAVVDL